MEKKEIEAKLQDKEEPIENSVAWKGICKILNS